MSSPTRNYSKLKAAKRRANNLRSKHEFTSGNRKRAGNAKGGRCSYVEEKYVNHNGASGSMRCSEPIKGFVGRNGYCHRHWLALTRHAE